jgi:ribosome-interacting GTPase 1
MTDIPQQIAAIEKEMRETPYHKGTEHHIGKLRAKLAKLKDRELETSSRKGGGKATYAVKKQGDATIVLVGHPSVGKSTLLNKLTNAQSKVAPYAFTTVSVIPGMLEYQDARIQILDVPGLIEGAEVGKGRGKEVLSVVRASDLIILMTDIQKPGFAKIEAALYGNGIRINQKPPRVEIEKKLSGGIIVHSNIKQPVSKQTIAEVASEMGLKNVEITLEEELGIERLIDAFSRSRVYIPALLVVNKIDQTEKTSKIPGRFYISAEKDLGLKELKEAIWQKLNFVRIYLLDESILMKKGQTLQDVANKIGSDFTASHKRAKIWGAGAKYPGQEVSLQKVVEEGMRVNFLV